MVKALCVTVAAITLLLFTQYAYGQSPQGSIKPFGISLEQAVPVTATFTTDGITRTVPITLQVALVINVESPISLTVGATNPPTVNMIDVEPTGIDQLGIPYTLSVDDDDITVTEWIAFENQTGELNFAGKIQLASDANPVGAILSDIRIYDHSDSLMHVDEIYGLDTGLDPGAVNPFDRRMAYIDPNDVGRYEVLIRVLR